MLELDTGSDFNSNETTEEAESFEAKDLEMMHFQTPHQREDAMKVLKALDKQICRKPEQVKRRSVKKLERSAKLRKCLTMMYGRRFGNFEPLTED